MSKWFSSFAKFNSFNKKKVPPFKNIYNENIKSYNISNLDDINDKYNNLDFKNNYLNKEKPKSKLMNSNVFSAQNKLDNISILKIQNQVLNKSNIDLKNYNRCLKDELNSYKKMTLGNISNKNIPLSIYDDNVNSYIQTLKNSLKHN